MPGLSSSNSSALLPCAIGTIIFWICATSVLLVQKDRSSYLPDWAMSMSMSDYSDRRPESNKSHSLGGVAVLTPVSLSILRATVSRRRRRESVQ